MMNDGQLLSNSSFRIHPSSFQCVRMHRVARELPTAVALDERESFDGIAALKPRVEGGGDGMTIAGLLLAPFDERATQHASEGVAHALKARGASGARRGASPA